MQIVYCFQHMYAYRFEKSMVMMMVMVITIWFVVFFQPENKYRKNKIRLDCNVNMLATTKLSFACK